jgi:mannose-6-phosphate isomerase-like protein (cupin superfamily)
MKYRISRLDVDPVVVAGDTVTILPLFDDAAGCEKFAQRVLRFSPGESLERRENADDEVLYVLEGAASVSVDGSVVEVGEGCGLFVARGTPWSLDAKEPVELVSVLVHDPEPAAGEHALVDIAAEARQSATAARQFVLGVTPEAGCGSVTQFIGFVPPGRAPDHFHRYDEVIYVLEGRGTLWIGGEQAPLGPGSCVHLPATLVHSLANDGDAELRLLGVFRPAGSPAEAYYPDGTPAEYPTS